MQVGEAEFKQLQGNIRNICMLAIDTVTESVKVTRTGAPHSYAKWFLLPVKMRARYKTDEYDFEKVRCGCVEYKEKLFFVYLVGKKLHPKKV